MASRFSRDTHHICLSLLCMLFFIYSRVWNGSGCKLDRAHFTILAKLTATRFSPEICIHFPHRVLTKIHFKWAHRPPSGLWLFLQLRKVLQWKCPLSTAKAATSGVHRELTTVVFATTVSRHRTITVSGSIIVLGVAIIATSSFL